MGQTKIKCFIKTQFFQVHYKCLDCLLLWPLCGCAGDWAPVSEPGFLDFHIFRFPIVGVLFVQNMFEKSGGEISRKK